MPITYPTNSSLRQTQIDSNEGTLDFSCGEETRISLFLRLVMLEPPSKFLEVHNSHGQEHIGYGIYKTYWGLKDNCYAMSKFLNIIYCVIYHSNDEN